VNTIFVEHGVNFGGSLNLFGGYNEEHTRKIENAIMAERVYSLDIDMPDYATMIANRKDAPSVSLTDALKEWQNKSETLHSTDLELPWLTIGDSHSAAWAPWNSMVVKENGKTLFGQARDGFPYVREYLEKCPQIEGITMVFGNIDVRHHLCRVPTEWKDMYREWKRFGDSLGIQVEYASPWPVEFEGRKLPKTGWYKGQPFWGSQSDRAALVHEIHSFMESEKMTRVKFPSEWFDLDPEAYAKERMERPQSVHLSPQFYRRHCEWSSQ
jgi:hypothetical protein